MTTLTGTTNNVIFFDAYAGAKLDLSHLSSNPSGRNYFQVNGTGSVLDLSSLPAIVSDQANNSLLSVTSGGSLLAPLLKTLTRTDLTIDGSSIVPTGQFTSYTGATITVNSGTPNFSGLTSISGNQVFANGGAVVAFPNVTSLSTPNGYNVSIQASGTSGPNGTGTPSEVDLSHVTSLTGTTNNVIFFNAYCRREARPQPPVLESLRPQLFRGQRHRQRARPLVPPRNRLRPGQQFLAQRDLGWQPCSLRSSKR